MLELPERLAELLAHTRQLNAGPARNRSGKRKSETDSSEGQFEEDYQCLSEHPIAAANADRLRLASEFPHPRTLLASKTKRHESRQRGT